MTYKTLLVQLDAGARCPARIALAAHLAARFGSHVVGVAATGLPDILVTMNSAVPDGVEFIQVTENFLRERAEAVASVFEQQLAAAGAASYESRVVKGGTVETIGRLARCSDLVLVGQDEPEAPVDGTTHDLPEQVMLLSGCPVLTVPYAGRFETIGTRALVAWKDTREAARAIREALPLLRGAAQVELIEVVEGSGPSEQARSALRDAQAWLARHGIAAEARLESVAGDVGETLLSRAADASADLLVMGAYGHARVREWVLGGATRHLLAHMTLPTLMAH
jgi:nucleotide-binding universal stress UspA family protein